VGYALEYFNERYAELSTELTSEMQGVRLGKQVDEYQLAAAWTANNDARSYVIFGDPAVRLRVRPEAKTGDEKPGVETVRLRPSAVTVEAPSPLSPYPLPAQGEGEIETVLGELKQLLLQGAWQPALDQTIKALQNVSLENEPLQWAELQMLLANIFAASQSGERVEQLRAAMQAYQRALQTYTREEHPRKWGEAQRRLAEQLAELYLWTGERHYARRAEEAYQRALTVFGREESPSEWSAPQYNLAHLAAQRYRREKDAGLAQTALEGLRNILQATSQQETPFLWAASHHELAKLKLERYAATGEASDQVEALHHLEAAIEAYPAEILPHQAANAQFMLGDLCLVLESGERAENIERAIQVYEALRQHPLNVFSKIEEGRVLAQLGDAYSQRIKGERHTNLEQALRAYQQGLASLQEEGDITDSEYLRKRIAELQADLGGAGESYRKAAR